MIRFGNFSGLRRSRQWRFVPRRRPIWQPIGYPAAPTHPPQAIGTRAPLGDQITSIKASFDFSVQRSPKYPHVRPQWATSRPRLASKVTPSPHPGHGAYKGTLWDPLAKIAGALVAGNSNLKLGDTPRALAAPNTGYGGRSRAPCSAPHRLRFASPRRWSTRVRVRQVSYALSSTTR